jgi:acyl-CoA thioester hydrolase
MGVVHHQNYISYFELARIEYLRNRGLNYSSWFALGIHLPVIDVHVRYRRAAYLDDLLTVESRLSELGRVRVRFDYRVLRDKNGVEELIAEGHTTLACVGNDHAPMRLPAEAVQVLLSRETQPSEIHS